MTGMIPKGPQRVIYCLRILMACIVIALPSHGILAPMAKAVASHAQPKPLQTSRRVSRANASPTFSPC